jgi:hypothetical protein
MIGDASWKKRMKIGLSSKSSSPVLRDCLSLVRHLSQDRLQVGYITLNQALPWFHSKATNMEHEDYTYMLKKVFSTISISLPSAELLSSLGRGPIALEGTTPRNSKALSPIGLIAI